MSNLSPPPSPAPTPAEPHSAARLAELVAALLGMILGAWWWCLVPGGRAMQARLRRDGAAFVAVMRGIAEGKADEDARMGHRPPSLDPLSRLKPARAGGGSLASLGRSALAAVSRDWRRAVAGQVADDAAPDDDDEWVLVWVACGAWPIRAGAVGIAFPAPEPAVPWPRGAWVRVGAV